MRRDYLISAVFSVTAPWLLCVSFLHTSSWRFRRWLITIFFTVFGSVMLLSTGDGFVHHQAVDTYYSPMPFGFFVDDLWRILTLDVTQHSRSKDVYIHVVSYFFGTVVDLPGLFFPFVATVYGYFFSGSVLRVLRNFKLSDANYVILSFVVIFLFVRGLEGFYTVRTWTGMWILVYGCLRYFETKHKRYLVMMFIPPFVHIGFLVLAIPAWIVLVFGNRPLVYSAIFLASSVTTVLPVDEATSVLSRTERGASQVSAYFVEEQQVALDQFEKNQGVTNWYNAYRKAGMQRWAPTVLVFTLLLSGIYIRSMSSYQKRIFSIGILTLAFSNATWFLYAVHVRSLVISMIFILAAFLMTRLDSNTKGYFVGLPPYYRIGLHLSIFLFAPLIIFNFSMTLQWMSVFIFGLPFLVWLDPDLNLSVKQFLGTLMGRN